MKCSCPKCRENIELDLPEVTEIGTSAACPACNARLTIYRESFAARALRRSNEISCAPCGGELGTEMHCPACGAAFPDYLVVSLGRKRARVASKKVKLKSSPFPKVEKNATFIPTLEMAMRPDTAPAKASLSTGAKFPKSVKIAITLVVVVALVAAGSMTWLKKKEEKSYAKKFVLAAYCIQAGADRSLNSCAKIAADWKARNDAGQPYKPQIAADDEKTLNTINAKLEATLRAQTQVPEKFSQCGDNLAKISGPYNKLRNLALSPGNSLQNFSDNVTRFDAEYQKGVKEFKNGMPGEIMEELVTASKAFKGLRPLLN